MCHACQVSNFQSPSCDSSATPTSHTSLARPARAMAPLRPVCILGLGLIGGSIMRDLRALGIECFGWNRSTGAARAAIEEGFDASCDLRKVLERAEDRGALIVIGTPVTAFEAMLDDIIKYAPTCGITDVISVKSAPLKSARARGVQERYVGAHPMAGSAQAGWAAGRQGLFDGAPWVLSYDVAAEATAAGTPVPQTWIDVFTQVAALGKALGSQLIPARAANHDDAVARISHMPHLVAYALAAAGERGGPLAISLAAGSFRDGTRVAAAAPEMVMSWCESNSEAVLHALDDVIERLASARTQLKSHGTAIDLAVSGNTARDRYEARPADRPVFRLRIGQGDWVSQLLLAESVGGQVDIF